MAVGLRLEHSQVYVREDSLPGCQGLASRKKRGAIAGGREQPKVGGRERRKPGRPSQAEPCHGLGSAGQGRGRLGPGKGRPGSFLWSPWEA